MAYQITIGILITILLTSCSEQPEISTALPPPNIIWLVAEDISPALSCYGDSLAATPRIDQIAQSGIRYNRAYATAPICAPARSCLMTGLYATSLGTQHLRCAIPFPEQLKTLPEHLSQAGYFTSNRNKTDYNFDPEGRWQHWSGSYAPWRYRTDEEPFFSFINVGPSHEGSVNTQARYEEFMKRIPEEQRLNPDLVTPPPYYPNTEESRTVWAHYYDILKLLDQNVGMVLDSLADDGLLENTIIFFFGDHGFGMPRYKRWLYQTGLRVPLLVRIPDRYQHYFTAEKGSTNDQLISFVDFAPTVLQLAGVPIPNTMEGQPFLGPNPEKLPPLRKTVFAARDRADDMFEMSRAVIDREYIYIRHYMPHLPYMQSGFIFGDHKTAFRALRNAKKANMNNEVQARIWLPKPKEELYHLTHDPQELHNLATNVEYSSIKQNLHQQLQEWMTTHRDLGLLPEAEYMIRSEGSTPYDYTRQNDAYQVKDILNAAELIGSNDIDAILAQVNHDDAGVRYWAAMGLYNLSKPTPIAKTSLKKLLDDESPSVQIVAAEALATKFDDHSGISILGELVQDDRPWVALQAARSIQLTGEAARTIIPAMYAVLEKNLAGEGATHRKYQDFNFAAFTSWALEWALKDLGEDVEVN